MSDHGLNIVADPLKRDVERGTTVDTVGKDDGVATLTTDEPALMEKFLEHDDFEVTEFLVFEKKENYDHSDYAQSVEEARKYDGVYRVTGEIPTDAVYILEKPSETEERIPINQ